MTIKANRAAARAYAAEREQERAEAIDRENVAHDMAKLDELRSFLIFKKKTAVDTQALLDAIDDHAEKLTGDRTALWAKDARNLTAGFKPAKD